MTYEFYLNVDTLFLEVYLTFLIGCELSCSALLDYLYNIPRADEDCKGNLVREMSKVQTSSGFDEMVSTIAARFLIELRNILGIAEVPITGFA